MLVFLMKGEPQADCSRCAPGYWVDLRIVRLVILRSTMSLYERVMVAAVAEALHRGSLHRPEDNYVHTQVLEVQVGLDKYVEDNLVAADN